MDQTILSPIYDFTIWTRESVLHIRYFLLYVCVPYIRGFAGVIWPLAANVLFGPYFTLGSFPSTYFSPDVGVAQIDQSYRTPSTSHAHLQYCDFRHPRPVLSVSWLVFSCSRIFFQRSFRTCKLEKYGLFDSIQLRTIIHWQSSEAASPMFHFSSTIRSRITRSRANVAITYSLQASPSWCAMINLRFAKAMSRVTHPISDPSSNVSPKMSETPNSALP